MRKRRICIRPSDVTKIKITNITYVHDPEAMQKWLALYVDLFKEALNSELANLSEDEHTFLEREVEGV
ncbi:hypothetical protein CA600_21165 [Paenibacillus sp. VTT E-133280]|jgi:hypothetical protein|nr:hypothetical protein CA600_21165 [Paenibacillus sp. VTT E-133280]